MIPLLIRTTLLSVVVAATWFFGGVQASFQAQCWVVLAGCLLAALWLTCVDSNWKRSAPNACYILALSLILPAAQLLLLPIEIRSLLAPATTSLQTFLQQELDEPRKVETAASLGSDQAASHRTRKGSHMARPISIFPAATRRAFSLIALGLVGLILGSQFFRTAGAQLALWVVMAVHGAILATFGLVQQHWGNGLLFWYLPLPDGGQPFGSFVNRNNAAGFLNLCLGCALGLAVWAGLRIGWRHAESPDKAANPWNARPEARRFSDQRGPKLLILALSVLSALLICGGVICSGSRGGVLALLAAQVAMMVYVCSVLRGRARWIGGTLGLLTILVQACWFSVAPTALDRLETLASFDQWAKEDRLRNWSNALHSVPDLWLTGSGLGTFGFISLPYERTATWQLHRHADNQFLEAAVAGGIVGLILCLALVAMTARSLKRVAKSASTHRIQPLVVVGLFALVSQLTQAWFDFGLDLPANLLLFAVVVGGLCGAAEELRSTTKNDSNQAGHPRRIRQSYLFFYAVFLILAAFAWHDSSTAGVIEDRMRESRWEDDPYAASEKEVIRAIKNLTAALQDRSDDAEGQSRLAELSIRLYRLRTLASLQKEHLQSSAKELWSLTDIGQLHTAAVRLESRPSDLERLRSEPLIRDNLAPAWRQLLQSRSACPFLPEVHLRLALLAVLRDGPGSDFPHLQRLQRLVPSDPRYLFAAGLLHLESRRDAQAYAAFRRCLEVDPGRRPAIVQLLGPQFGREKLGEPGRAKRAAGD